MNVALRLFQMKKLHWTDCKFDRTYFLYFFKNAAWALTSGGFRIVSDTFVNFVLLFAYFVSILAVLFFFLGYHVIMNEVVVLSLYNNPKSLIRFSGNLEFRTIPQRLPRMQNLISVRQRGWCGQIPSLPQKGSFFQF